MTENLPKEWSDRLAQRVALAGAILLWEALWPLLWPLPGLVLLFVAIALFDVLPLLPDWVHAAVLVGFLFAFLVLALRLRRLAAPGLLAAEHRLENDSGVLHRPLLAIRDHLATDRRDPVAQTLWQEQRQRLGDTLQHLKPHPPAPCLARSDPWGLRFIPLMLLIIALTGGWQDAPQRLGRAINPGVMTHLAGPPPTLQVWITPPAYTGAAPQILDPATPDAVISVPTGSVLLAQAQGGRGTPKIAINDVWKSFTALDADSHRFELTLRDSAHLEIHQGYRMIAAWSVTVTPDQAPSIAFTRPPDHDAAGRLHLEFEAHDDYGVSKAWVVLRRADTPDEEAQTLPLPVGSGHRSQLHQAAWLDLTGHPWAGLSVTLQPVAEDAIEQQGNGEAVTITLPERRFIHPVARRIIALRQILAAINGTTDPVQLGRAEDQLAQIAADVNAYDGDLLVFLALADARARLRHDFSTQAIPDAMSLMWSAALRVEEGERPMTEHALDEASRELEQALADGTDEHDVDRLVEQLQTALDRYLQALHDQAEKHGQPDPLTPAQRSVTTDELRAQIESLHDLARTGSRQGAQEKLSQLRRMLEGLRAASDGGQVNPQMQQAQQTADGLNALIREQQDLLDQTFRQNQASETLSNDTKRRTGAQAGKQETARQEKLRERLKSMVDSLGAMGNDIPDALGQADHAMRDATQALRTEHASDAVQAQSEAVAQLRQGAQALLQSLADRFGAGAGQTGQEGHDPLGRLLDSGTSSGDQSVKIPEQSDTQKAREVLDELRRRAGDPSRRPTERDYLWRLLHQLY